MSASLSRAEVAQRVRAEGPVPLTEACRLVPAPTPTGHAGPATLLRYIVTGKHGVHLDAARVKGKWHTSPAAISRFLNALADRAQRDKETVWG